MASIQDAKGYQVATWGRYLENIAAAGSFAGYSDESGNKIPFGLYLAEESTLVCSIIENKVDGVYDSLTLTLGAGYHPINFVSITSSTTAAITIFAGKPQNA